MDDRRTNSKTQEKKRSRARACYVSSDAVLCGEEGSLRGQRACTVKTRGNVRIDEWLAIRDRYSWLAAPSGGAPRRRRELERTAFRGPHAIGLRSRDRVIGAVPGTAGDWRL